MNGKKFIEGANRLRRIVRLPEFKKEQLTVCTFKKYITDKERNSNILYSFYKKNQITLVLADAGKGKTYAISKLNQRLYEDSSRKKGILKGKEEDYDLPFLKPLEGTSIFVGDYSFTESNNPVFKNYTPNSDEILLFNNDGSLNKDFFKNLGLIEVDLGILICPSKNQNHQNEENTEYQMIALTADRKQIKTEDLLKEDKTISAVFEKIGDFETLYKYAELEGIKVKISLTIDEAHLLVEQLNFRDKAIKEINKMTGLILKNNGSVLMLTATPQSLMLIDNVTSIVDFREEETEIKTITDDMTELEKEYSNCKSYKAPTGKIDIAYNLNDYVSMVDFTADIIDKKDYSMFRYNNKNSLKKIEEYFHKKGQCILTADGSQKEIETLQDGSKRYKNEIFNSIIKHECLPKYARDGRKVKSNGVTSSLEVGTNNKGIGEMKGDKMEIKEDPNFSPIYVNDNSRQSYVSNMIQFFNRARFNVKAYTIISKYEGIRLIIPIEEITQIEFDKVETNLGYLNTYKKMFEAEITEKEELINRINQFIAIKDLRDESLDLNCIYFDTDIMDYKINYNALFKKIYDQFYQQYFYNIIENIKLTEEEFGVKVHLKLYAKNYPQANSFLKEILDFYKIDYDIKGLDILGQYKHLKSLIKTNFDIDIDIVKKEFYEDIEMTDIKESDVIKVLEDIKGSPVMQKEIIEGDIKNIDILKIQGSPLYEKLEKILEYDIEIEEALKLTIEMDNKAIVRAKYNSLKEKVNKFTDAEFNDLKDAIQKRKKITDTNINIAKTISHILDNKTLAYALQTAFTIELKQRVIVDLFVKSADVSTFNANIFKRQFIYFNKMYLRIKGVPSLEHQVILDNLYILNESGNLINTEITTSVIDALIIDLKKRTTNSYNESDVMKLINLCFVINKGNNKIRSIRLNAK